MPGVDIDIPFQIMQQRNISDIYHKLSQKGYISRPPFHTLSTKTSKNAKQCSENHRAISPLSYKSLISLYILET